MDSGKNTLYIALLCAIAVHVSLVFIKIGSSLPIKNSVQQTITVEIQKLLGPPEVVESRIDEIEPTTQETPQPIEPELPQETVLKESLITTQEATQDQVTISTNINSTEFKKWVKQEVEQHLDNNPTSLDEFAQSFAVPTVVQQSDIVKEYSPLQTGLYATTVNGKVTCHLQMVLPFQNDWSTVINTQRDCTPEKKFTLNIN